jgi:uncharacterized membrane protein YhhN
MYKKLSQLSFVIGLFFFIVAILLFVNELLSAEKRALTWRTAICFALFGIIMMTIKNKEE